MSVSDGDIAFAMELFMPLGDLTKRKMFGGLGIYHAGNIFCVVSSEGRIFLKCKGDLAQTLAADGSDQFHNMPYWSLPDAALDDPQDASDLAHRAINGLVD